MKRIVSSFAAGVVLTAGILLSLAAFAQDGPLAFVRPLVVDIRQLVPIVADVVVPMENGESVTATVPLTVEVALQVSVSGVVSQSVQAVEETQPEVAIATATPAPAGALTSSSFIGFNQLPELEPGNLDELSIVSIGAFEISSSFTRIPLIVRNNTDEIISRVEVSAVASEENGKMIAVGGGDGFRPNSVMPGDLTMAYIRFSDIQLPNDASLAFEVTSRPVGEFENIRDLTFEDHSILDNRIVGILGNPHDIEVTGPIAVTIYCFDSEHNLVAYFNDYTEKDSVAPGGTVPFQVGIEQPCDYYLISASGYE